MFLVENPEILEGYRRGDATAFEQIYLHYAPALYRYLHRGFAFNSNGKAFSFSGLKEIAEQEAFVQEAFVRCFGQTARQNYDGQRPFLFYLQRTCRNLLLQDLKKRNRMKLQESTKEFTPKELQSANELHSQQTRLEQQELEAVLTDFLRQCDARDREVFHALYEEGDSQEEAAQRLGMGRSQIRTSLKRLRKGLLLQFKQTGYLSQLQRLPETSQLLLFLGPWGA